MIRRDVPREADTPSHWLLIPQVEHARLSHQLAAAWKGLLPAATEEVRAEFLAAIWHHDDGWLDWQDRPQLDPEHGRPYGFTEMPIAEAQAIWSRSIDHCRAIGPLAGWIVATHFVHLQSKQDDNFADWAPWIEQQNTRRAGWLAEWQASGPGRTAALANECLDLLQAFDWISLWLCCRAPLDDDDPVETLTVGGAKPITGPVPLHLRPTETGRRLLATPWPFESDFIDLHVAAQKTEAAVYASWATMRLTPTELRWRFVQVE